jgi:ribosomal protein S18 acetylase RimI-like enzyme
MSQTTTSDKTAWVHELEHNLWEMWSNFGCGTGCSLHDEGDVLWFETPIPTIPYNGILKFRASADTDLKIDRLVSHFNQRDVPFMWVVHPTSQPHDLPERLKKRGLLEAEVLPGMARTLAALPDAPPLSKGVQVRILDDKSDVSAYYDFAAWRWGIPPEHRAHFKAVTATFRFGQPGSKACMWQAWRDGQPVAKAGTYLTVGSAGIYAVATRPEARRQGLAGTLTLTALQHARRLGHDLAVLHSSPMAESLYQSLGFETVAKFRLFASEETHI